MFYVEVTNNKIATISDFSRLSSLNFGASSSHHKVAEVVAAALDSMWQELELHRWAL